jgi:exodeoxyribonuclease V gamma subunit
VPGVRDSTVLRCTYSKLGPKHRLRAWAMFLALSAARPETGPSAVTVGQAPGSSPGRPRLSVCTLTPLAESPEALRAGAFEMLEILVDLYQRGMREPLPIYCATSAAWAQARRQEDDAHERARSRWSSASDEFPGEDSEPEHLTVLGAGVAFEELLEGRAADDETGPGWSATEPSRFGRLAMRLWGPVLRHERLRER